MTPLSESTAEYAVGACPNCGTLIGPTAAGTTIRQPNDVFRLMAAVGLLEREELWVILLNTKNMVMATERVYQGNVSSSLVRVGELFREAIRTTASGIILVHNHPSGDPTPSPDDLHLTAETVAAGKLLDIPLIDHVVIGRDAYRSFRDMGVSFDRRKEAPPSDSYGH